MQKDEATREQMFKMISTWQQSGLSQKSFCEQNGIRYHVFHYWYKCFVNCNALQNMKVLFQLRYSVHFG